MATVRVENEALGVEIDGIHALLSFQSSFRVPWSHVKSATADAPPLNQLYKGIQNLGTHIPGVIAAGTYFTSRGRVFWDARVGQELVCIDLQDEKYDELVLGVDDARRVIRKIHQTLNA